MSLLNNILKLFKYSLFTVVFSSMLLQTVLLTISAFSNNETELIAKVDWEEDNDEEKNETKDEKISQEIDYINNSDFLYKTITNCYQITNPLWDFYSEILIPPPQHS